MMQFLTRILSKKDNILPANANSDLAEEVTILRAEVENNKKILQQQNSTLRDYALANEALCTEVAMMAKWIIQKAKEEGATDPDSILGYADIDDDEYLN